MQIFYQTGLQYNHESELYHSETTEPETCKGTSSHNIILKEMTRLIGESKMCPQEVCHLVLGLLMVQCPHTFVKINIEKRSLQLELDEQNNRNIVYENNE